MSDAPPAGWMTRIHLLVLLAVGVGGLVIAGIAMSDGASSRSEGKATGGLLAIAGFAVVWSLKAWRAGPECWVGAPWWLRPGPCLLAFAALLGIGALAIDAGQAQKRVSYRAYHEVMEEHAVIYRAYRTGAPLDYLRTAGIPDEGRRAWLIATVERHAAERPGQSFPPGLPNQADAEATRVWRMASPATPWLDQNDREEHERSGVALELKSSALGPFALGVLCVFLGCLVLFLPVFPAIGLWHRPFDGLFDDPPRKPPPWA